MKGLILDIRRLLGESPGLIPPTNFKLDDPNHNRKELRKRRRDHRTEQIFDHNGLPVYKTGNCIWAPTPDGFRIGYTVQWEDHKYGALPCRSLVQIKVWRYPSSIYNGLAKHVFWDLLFPQYGCMVTDYLQTDDGKRFWEYRIVEALQNGLVAKLVNFYTNENWDVQQDDIFKVGSAAYPKEWMRLVVVDPGVQWVHPSKPLDDFFDGLERH